jgi:hypothetical protein
VCRQIDERGKAWDLAGAGPLLDRLDAEYARVDAAIRQMLRSA